MENKKTILFDTSMASKKPRTVGLNEEASDCQFCKTEKMMKTNVVLAKQGKFLWVENKYPILKNTYQTVLLETDTCEEDLTTYSLEYAKELFKFALEKRKELLSVYGFKEVLFFKNHGALADASIKHAHMQLVGLTNNQLSLEEIQKTTKGYTIYEAEGLQVNVSDIPLSEFYEFNICWEKQNVSYDFVYWVQTIIRYLEHFKDGKFQDYNFSFYEFKDTYTIKIFPRKPASLYLLAYGLKQLPNDIQKVALEVRKYAFQK